MKYSELISFHPIEDVIQLTTAGDAVKAREYVRTYVMSDKMADSLKATVIDQLQMDEVINNKGVLVVGNYGTGKSHLMSVISAVAFDADNLQYLQNKKFAESMVQIAGKFEVLRIEIGGVTMSLREILFGFIQEDFDSRGINFEVPDFATVKDNKKLIKDMMLAFSEKCPDKGYLIVVDEFLSYLLSRNERDIVLDLEFFRALGEMCSKSKMRVIFGVQEKIFGNPRFSFVSDTLMHVKDRITPIIITKEATSYVVSERILKKTPKQKALIRAHLEKFSSLYAGMSSRMDEFVDLFPIHPAYIDVFNKVYLIENRHILKNISLTIKHIFDTEVPEDAPGVISFDDYWPAIKSNDLLRSDVTVSLVLGASQQLEDIIHRSFQKVIYKPMAIQIIYALSVYRLTTSGLEVQFGLTAENLKDDLCLYLAMPEQDANADFLLGAVKATLREIMKTVSGEFIISNEENGQYYIDVNKIVDFDEQIKQLSYSMAVKQDLVISAYKPKNSFIKDADAINLDLLNMASQKNYTDLREYRLTQQFIESKVCSRENIAEYLKLKMAQLEAEITTATSYQDWFRVANLKASIDVMAVEYELHMDTEQTHKPFTEYILASYGKLSSLIDRSGPVLVSRAMEYMHDASNKFAIVVMDGMSEFDWHIIADSFSGIRYEKTNTFAMIPTTTSISRQSLLSGKYPVQLMEPWNQSKERNELFDCARKLGFTDDQVGYERGYDADFATAVKCAAIIINDVDDLVHGQTQGRIGMFNDITILAKQQRLAGLVKRLLRKGFDVYITADHGNTPCMGLGKLMRTGVEVETKSRRMVILRDFADKQALLTQYELIEYPKYYLSKEFDYLICDVGCSFDAKGEDVMSHGGITIDEIIVPFIKVKADANNG